MLMLDQRGTGRSTPIGTLPGLTGGEQAEYLAHFRADAIVRDAELIRRELGVERWSVLGQSFGGLCVMTYLSIAPEGLREAFVTGGLAPLGPRIDDVYRATYARTLERSRRYYERYPDDRERVRALRERLEARRRPPAVGRPADRAAPAPARRHAGHERRRRGAALHPRAAGRLARLPPRRRGGARLRAQPALRRAARGVLGRRRRDALGGASACCPPSTRTSPSCSSASTSSRGCSRTTGRWPRCARRPTSSPSTSGRACTTPSAWPPTRCRSPPRSTPRTCTSSGRFSEETAAHIRGLRPWLTNEYEHNGLRADGERVLGRLIDLARGRA